MWKLMIVSWIDWVQLIICNVNQSILIFNLFKISTIKVKVTKTFAVQSTHAGVYPITYLYIDRLLYNLVQMF